ncbi:MAG: AzlD domain-containing protein [Acetobacteraceae bacterium]|nr:AzlD domain-containing protein [Acetobacteraceae bacterium]
MTLDPLVLAAILAMSVATYATRAGGYVLFRAIRPNESVRRVLSYIPGALFTAYVAPALADGGWPQWIGAAAALLLMRITRQIAVAILGGTAVAWVVWAWA